MNGMDLLKKLENLDPGLVAAAAEPPEPKVRRGPDWGAWAAAAACVAAICLPLALMYLVHGVVPTIEPRGSGAGSASHQVSLAEDGSRAKRSSTLAPEISQPSYDSYTWTEYKLTQEYCAAYPDGLPAEEYFKYNVQGLRDIPEVWWLTDDLSSDVLAPEETEKWLGEFTDQLPGLGSDYTDISLSVNPEFAENSDLPQHISIRAIRKDAWDEDRGDGLLAVDINSRIRITDEALAKARVITNETVAVHDSWEIVYALGGLDSDRVLYSWCPGEGLWWYITAGRDVPPEDMVAVMNWLLGEPGLFELFDTEGCSDVYPPSQMDLDYLSESLPPEVIPYIPYYDTNDYAPHIRYYNTGLQGAPGQPENEMHLHSAEFYYEEDRDGRLLEIFRLDELETWEGEDESIGDLYAITIDRNIVDSQYKFQQRFIANERSSDRYKENVPMHYKFSFTWDSYYVTATFNESLTADQLWGFLNQLAGKEQPMTAKARIQAMLSKRQAAYDEVVRVQIANGALTSYIELYRP